MLGLLWTGYGLGSPRAGLAMGGHVMCWAGHGLVRIWAWLTMRLACHGLDWPGTGLEMCWAGLGMGWAGQMLSGLGLSIHGLATVCSGHDLGLPWSVMAIDWAGHGLAMDWFGLQLGWP